MRQADCKMKKTNNNNNNNSTATYYTLLCSFTTLHCTALSYVILVVALAISTSTLFGKIASSFSLTATVIEFLYLNWLNSCNNTNRQIWRWWCCWYSLYFMLLSTEKEKLQNTAVLPEFATAFERLFRKTSNKFEILIQNLYKND